MTRTRRALGVAAAVLAVGPVATAGQDAAGPPALEARVWLDRGTEPLLDRGDRVRIYYRTSDDAYVALFHINTDGALTMLVPRGPDDAVAVRGEQDFRVLFPTSPYWFVDEYEGKGYFFLVASPVPFDFGQLRYVGHQQAWDLSALGRTVYGDPYLAVDEVVAAILPDWESVPYALDFISYDVGATQHDYPRFLCYECHGFRSYASWNPYTYACTDFRVVIYDDPYFLPAYRYGPTRVVYTSALRGRARFEFKERTVGEAWSPLTRTRQPPARRITEYLEPSAAAPPPARVAPPRRRVVPSDAVRPDASARPGQDGSAAPRRRPAGATPSPADVRRSGAGQERPGTAAAAPTRRPVTSVRPGAATPGAVTPGAARRPTLERRPATPPSAGVARPDPRAGTRPSTRVVRPPAASGRPDVRARPSDPRGGTRVVFPPRAPARPPIRPAPRPGASGSSGARPTVRPSGGNRPPPVRRPAARPKKPPKGGSGGGGAGR